MRSLKLFTFPNNCKVLVYDSYGQSVISPLLNVKQLRDLGVTLHLFVVFVFNIFYFLLLV